MYVDKVLICTLCGPLVCVLMICCQFICCHFHRFLTLIDFGPDTHGKHLHELLQQANDVKERVEMYSVQGCGHNDIEYRRGREFKRTVKRFIAEQIKNAVHVVSSDEDGKADDEADDNQSPVASNNRRKKQKRDLVAVHTDSAAMEMDMMGSKYTAPTVQGIFGLQSVDSNSEMIPPTPTPTEKPVLGTEEDQ